MTPHGITPPPVAKRIESTPAISYRPDDSWRAWRLGERILSNRDIGWIPWCPSGEMIDPSSPDRYAAGLWRDKRKGLSAEGGYCKGVVMTIEEQIRRKHQLEDRMRLFLREVQDYRNGAMGLNLRKVEIAMARLADSIQQHPDSPDHLDKLFKGTILKSVYDAKRAGCKPSILDFVFVGSASISWYLKYKFSYPVPLTEETISSWAQADEVSAIKLLHPG